MKRAVLSLGKSFEATENFQMTYYRKSERSAILAPAQAAIKNPRK